MGEERFLLQLNGVFMVDTNPCSETFKKPFKYTNEELIQTLDTIVYGKGDVILVFVV